MADLPEVLRDIFPDEMLFDDLRTVLEECGWQLELDERDVDIPRDVRLETVVRSCHLYEHSRGFGNYTVVVAIGGIRSVANGIVEAGQGFASLWYSSTLNLITVDVYTVMRNIADSGHS